MMCICLVAHGGRISDHENQEEQILHKVSYSIQQGPDMDVARSTEALVVIKDRFILATDQSHGREWKKNGNGRMEQG